MFDPLPDDRPLAGDEPFAGPFRLEGWASPEDRQTVRIQAETITPEGRRLRPGDMISPREARRLNVPVVETSPVSGLEHK